MSVCVANKIVTLLEQVQLCGKSTPPTWLDIFVLTMKSRDRGFVREEWLLEKVCSSHMEGKKAD